MGGTGVSMHRLEAADQAERAHINNLVCMLRLHAFVNSCTVCCLHSY